MLFAVSTPIQFSVRFEGEIKMQRTRCLLFFSVVFFVFLAGCACPDGKKFSYLEPARISELKASFAKISDEEFNDLLKSYDFAKEFLPKQAIVKFSSEASQSQVSDTLRTLSANPLIQFKSTNALLIDIPDAPTRADVLAIITALNEVKSVEYAVPNGILKLTSVPNDPYYPDLDNLRNVGQADGTSGADIRAEEAWKITTGSKDVLVGVIDTGIDYLHPDLAENMWRNPGETGIDEDGFDRATNGVDDDGNGYVDDVYGWDFANGDNDPLDDFGHGTHVAGTIGAVGNNGVGVTGIAWNVSLVAIKVFGESGGATDANIIQGIEYATTNKILITNNSWGGFGFNQATKDAIEANARAGGLFIAAAGNESSDSDQIKFYPANYGVENIISVGALTNKDEKAKFSNFGSHSVHIGAPGENILSLAMSQSGQLVTRMSGTSMAAPHVAGAAALIKAAYPESTAQQIRNRILYGSDKIPQLLSMQWVYSMFRSDGYPVDKPLFEGGRRLNLGQSLEADYQAPGAISQPRLNFFGLTQVGLVFGAAGDDGASGKAAEYIAATSPVPIIDEEQWESASKYGVGYLDEEGSQNIKAEVMGLEPFSKGYLTLRAVDNAGNLGPMTPSIHFEMSKPTTIYHNDGESDEGMIFKNVGTLQYNPFLREVVEGRGNVWSDSPESMRNNTDQLFSHYMEFPEITISHSDTILQFQTKLDCMLVQERGEVEYLLNNQNDPTSGYNIWDPEKKKYVWVPAKLWRKLSIYSASQCEWGEVNISLRDKVAPGDKLKIRFVFKGTGGDEVRDGWMIDDIKFLAPGVPETPSQLKAIKPDYLSPYRLVWTDNSDGETRFELKRGQNIVQSTEVNQVVFDTGLQQIENEWQVRACNGTVCSSWSETNQVLPAPPQLESISPNAGALQGGTLLNVKGMGFHSQVSIRIGGLPCSNINLISTTELTCLTPAHEPSIRTIVSVDQHNQKSYLIHAYQYQAAPTVQSIVPNLGSTGGGQWITILGSGFNIGTQALLGSEACQSVEIQSNTQLRCLTPAINQGWHPVLVKNTDNQDSSANLTVKLRALPPRWIATVGGVCSRVCNRFKMVSIPSPEGAYCSSGEVIPFSAKRSAVPYHYGCWPHRDCRPQGYIAGAQSVGRFCYGSGQRRDRGRKDITMGCYCSY